MYTNKRKGNFHESDKASKKGRGKFSSGTIVTKSGFRIKGVDGRTRLGKDIDESIKLHRAGKLKTHPFK